MAKTKRPRNASGNHAWVEMSAADIQAMINEINPNVEKILEATAGRIATKAEASDAFKDSNKTHEKPDPLKLFATTKRHKHLRRSFKVKESKFPYGGYIVQAAVPHAHLVEYGHMMVSHDGRTLEPSVPPHSFLRVAKNEVQRELPDQDLK